MISLNWVKDYIDIKDENLKDLLNNWRGFRMH